MSGLYKCTHAELLEQERLCEDVRSEWVVQCAILEEMRKNVVEDEGKEEDDE